MADHLQEDNEVGKDPEFMELKYQQVCRLHLVMSESIQITGKPGSNFPTLVIQLHSLVELIRTHLTGETVELKDVRLNGGAASYVLQSTGETPEYNDVDLIFRVDLSKAENGSNRVKNAVLRSLQEVLKECGDVPRSCCLGRIEDAYLFKMVKVCTDSDCWSLISLMNAGGRDVELKFVDRMKRQFEFSVDSFQIVLDNLLLFYRCDRPCLSKTRYPRVLATSVYGQFAAAIAHLDKKLIVTRSPEQIRGGGLLKYCNLIARGYTPMDARSTQKYMCSRFFIDFPDVAQQRQKLENYLADHFLLGDDGRKFDFLRILLTVVGDSTVCLMGQERRQTLDLIVYFICQQAVPDPYAGGYYHGQTSYQCNNFYPSVVGGVDENAAFNNVIVARRPPSKASPKRPRAANRRATYRPTPPPLLLPPSYPYSPLS